MFGSCPEVCVHFMEGGHIFSTFSFSVYSNKK